MWTLLTGHLLSISFKYQIVELFKNKLSNETLSFSGVFLGWLFQEYIREEFEFTGGKRFMLESDFRNRLFTQSFKIFRNLIIYPYLVTTLELGTFLLLFGSGVSIIIEIHWLRFIKFKTKIIGLINSIEFENTKNYESSLNKIFTLSYTPWKLKFNNILLFFFSGFIFKYVFFKIYSWYDTIFILTPLFLSLLIVFIVFSFMYTVYIIYIHILYNFSKNWTLTLKLFIMKLYFFVIKIGFYLILFLYDLNLQNLTTENFFKEMFFKNFIIFYQIICLKQK